MKCFHTSLGNGCCNFPTGFFACFLIRCFTWENWNLFLTRKFRQHLSTTYWRSSAPTISKNSKRVAIWAFQWPLRRVHPARRFNCWSRKRHPRGPSSMTSTVLQPRNFWLAMKKGNRVILCLRTPERRLPWPALILCQSCSKQNSCSKRCQIAWKLRKAPQWLNHGPISPFPVESATAAVTARHCLLGLYFTLTELRQWSWLIVLLPREISYVIEAKYTYTRIREGSSIFINSFRLRTSMWHFNWLEMYSSGSHLRFWNLFTLFFFSFFNY